MGVPIAKRFDYQTIAKEDLFEVRAFGYAMPVVIPPCCSSCSSPSSLFYLQITFDIDETMPVTREITGLASWFDSAFQGQDAEIILSTAPQSALTHWYQVSWEASVGFSTGMEAADMVSHSTCYWWLCRSGACSGDRCW